MNTNELPKTIYKYQYWASEFGKNILVNNEIFFSSPGNFNDPFDCDIVPRYDLASISILKDHLSKSLKTNEPNLNRQEIRKRVSEKNIKRKFKTERYWTEIEPELRNRIENEVGIFSASYKKDNILLWSHYAYKHKGYCIGLNVKILEDLAYRLISTQDKALIMDSVQYGEEYPELIPGGTDDKEIFQKSMLYKSEDWKYEAEFRLVIYNGCNYKIKLPERVVSEVILGCAITDSDKKEILETLKSYYIRPKLFEAIKLRNKFKIEIIPADDLLNV